MAKTAALVWVFCLFSLTAHGKNGEDIVGIWENADHRARVEIFNCNGQYCGRIISLKDPIYPPDDKRGMGGKPVVDRENPDPLMRDRPLLGLLFMKGFIYTTAGIWENGTIYDPETGNTYRGKILLESSHRLKLKGYIGIPLLGRSTVWTR